MPHEVPTMRCQQDFSSKTAAATRTWPQDEERRLGLLVHVQGTQPFTLGSSSMYRIHCKDKLLLRHQPRATSTWQSICPSKAAIWEKVSFIPAEQQGAAAWPISSWVDLYAQPATRLGLLTPEQGQEDSCPGRALLAQSCHTGAYAFGDKTGLTGVTRALPPVSSLGNIHGSKYLGSGGGSCPHQLPTHLAFSPGDIWPGVTPPSLNPLHVWHQTRFAKGVFPCRKQDFQPPPGTWWWLPGQRGSGSPAAHPSLHEVPGQCHKAPGSALHHRSYDREAKKVKMTFLY